MERLATTLGLLALLLAGVSCASPGYDETSDKTSTQVNAALNTIHRATALKGLDLEDSSGTNQGTIEDLVIDVAGSRAVAAVKLKGEPDRIILVPLSTVTIRLSKDADKYGKRDIVGAGLNMDAVTVQTAPSIAAENWKDGVSIDLVDRVNRLRPTADAAREAVERATGSDQPRTVAAWSSMKERDVRSPERKDLGALEDLMVDTSDGNIVYAIIASGGFVGIGTKRHAVPFGTLEWSDTDPKGFVLVAREDLRGTVMFDNARSKDPQWIDTIYEPFDLSYDAVSMRTAPNTKIAMAFPEEKTLRFVVERGTIVTDDLNRVSGSVKDRRTERVALAQERVEVVEEYTLRVNDVSPDRVMVDLTIEPKEPKKGDARTMTVRVEKDGSIERVERAQDSRDARERDFAKDPCADVLAWIVGSGLHGTMLRHGQSYRIHDYPDSTTGTDSSMADVPDPDDVKLRYEGMTNKGGYEVVNFEIVPSSTVVPDRRSVGDEGHRPTVDANALGYATYRADDGFIDTLVVRERTSYTASDAARDQLQRGLTIRRR